MSEVIDFNKAIKENLEEEYLIHKVWRASKVQLKNQSNNNAISTTHKQLDAILKTQGWPIGVTNEIALSQTGIGELRLLLPALRNLQQDIHWQKNTLWIAPPYHPFAPALKEEGIDLKQLTIIKTNTMADTLWAAEQALLSGCCTAVFSWLGKHRLNTRSLRRLQLASEKTGTWSVLMRHSDCLAQPSTSGLRLYLQARHNGKLDIEIIKQPFAWGGQRCTLSLAPHYEHWQRLSARPDESQHSKSLSQTVDSTQKELKQSS